MAVKKKRTYTLSLHTPGIKSHAERNYEFEYKVIREKNDTDSKRKEKKRLNNAKNQRCR
jgi:hypothetical protein